MKCKWIIGLKLTVFSLLLFLTVGSWCPGTGGNGETPPDSTGCGVGEGNYDFELVDALPQGFNCNNSSKFLVTFDPEIDARYSGDDVFNRLSFDLVNDSNYRSNYIEFPSWNTNNQQLEWGGSVPSDSYLVRATMKNIQLNSSCRDSTFRIIEKDLGWIHITEYSNPQKVMQIEYFCQYSDIGDIDRYDVFLSPNTDEYIDIAFNVANTTYNLMPYGLYLEPELVIFTEQEISKYIKKYKNWGWNMFLCGIKGFTDEKSGLLPNQLGVTYEDDWITCAPSESTGSLIAVKTCIDYATSDEYRMDYNDLVTGMTIHELGLQRGAVEDEHSPPQQDDPMFCIGHRSLIHWEPDQDRQHPYLFVRHWNPHFCDECITRIKNITW